MEVRCGKHKLPVGGFSLVELLMALLVLTVGLLGLLQSINVAHEHNLRNRVREQAVQLGEEKMVALRRMSSATARVFPNSSTVHRLVAGSPRAYQVTQDCLVLGGTRRLKVKVEWELKRQRLSHAVYSLKYL
jgi:type IV pilus assembly protein PilV